MQAMHAAENRKLEWDWIGVAQALVFRVGMKAFQNQFKSLWDRATPEQKAALQAADDTRIQGNKEVTPQRESPTANNASSQNSQISAKTARERLEPIIAQDRAATRSTQNPSKNPDGNEAFTFPKGEPNQFIYVNGQKWTFKQKSQSWARNNGNGESILMKPGETLVF